MCSVRASVEDGVSADVMLSVVEASGRARAAKKATRVYISIPAKTERAVGRGGTVGDNQILRLC